MHRQCSTSRKTKYHHYVLTIAILCYAPRGDWCEMSDEVAIGTQCFLRIAIVAAVNLEARRVAQQSTWPRGDQAPVSDAALALSCRQSPCRLLRNSAKCDVVAEKQANSNSTSSFILTFHVSIVRIRRRSWGSVQEPLAMSVSSAIRASLSGRYAASCLRVARPVSLLGASAFHHDFISTRLQQPTIQLSCAP